MCSISFLAKPASGLRSSYGESIPEDDTTGDGVFGEGGRVKEELIPDMKNCGSSIVSDEQTNFNL